MRRRSVVAALVSAVACVAAFGSSPPATAGLTTTLSGTGPAPSGVEEPASAIPWGSVGPGWFVALWGSHAGYECCPPPRGWERQRSTLYLVDPLGGRYRVATMPAPSYYSLFDWSGDGRRVLVGTPPTGAQSRFEVEDVDLATGKVLHHFRGPSSIAWYQYTRPDGLAVLASPQTAGARVAPLVRLSLSGATQLSYPTTFPGVGELASGGSGPNDVLPSLDGTELVVEAHTGLALLANDGTFIRDVGPSGEACSPQRWWDVTDLVASCQPIASEAEAALWLVPANGETATQLTFPRPPDLGDLDGWKVGTAIYTQAAGPCGSEFLARRLSGGRTAAVPVPHAGDDVRVIGVHGSQLALQAMLGCGPGPSLFWFDPATGKQVPLLGGPMNGGGVLAALPYPGLEP
ncbi:MAG TPA: hypothetical protein VK425_02005 [Acidimicrobiales bacterium]|nr:hypothetical protein [Acidimicrobiales bacterium]